MKILLVAINAKYIHSNPAVYILKAFTKEYADYIEIAEYAINQPESYILSDIYSRKADVIAFSCYIWNISIIKNLIKNVTSIMPDINIWIGGPEVSFNSENIIRQMPEITGIIIGEGENTFKELVKFYCNKNNKNINNVNNINNTTNSNIINNIININGLLINTLSANDLLNNEFLDCDLLTDNFENNFIYTKDRALTDINEIPFIYNDNNINNFKNKIIYYESSRGCPFRCSYCLSSIDKSLRLRNIDTVKKELQFFIDHKIPQVKFIDRTFNCNKEHSLSIWKYILEHDNGITNFHFEISADLITDEELSLIKQMRPGLIQLEIGVQSTNELTIKEIRRTMNLSRLREVVLKIHSFKNTHQHLDLIAGLPFENFDSFINSFNDVYSMKPDQLQLGFLKVLNGTYIASKLNDYQIKYLSNPPYEVLSTKWISYDEILKLKGIEEMVELYYNSGQFCNTISFLENAFSSPFEMYKYISEDYIENAYDIRKPARSYRYEILYAFVKKYDSKNEAIYKELLTFDMYLRENCKQRPSFARDLKDFKKEIYSKETNRKNHIDVFKYISINKNQITYNSSNINDTDYKINDTDYYSFIDNNNNFNDIIINADSNEYSYIEFNYSKTNPLNNNASIKLV